MKNKTTNHKEPSLAELVKRSIADSRAISATNTLAAKKAGAAVKEVLDEKNASGKRKRKNLVPGPAAENPGNTQTGPQ